LTEAVFREAGVFLIWFTDHDRKRFFHRASLRIRRNSSDRRRRLQATGMLSTDQDSEGI